MAPTTLSILTLKPLSSVGMPHKISDLARQDIRTWLLQPLSKAVKCISQSLNMGPKMLAELSTTHINHLGEICRRHMLAIRNKAVRYSFVNLMALDTSNLLDHQLPMDQLWDPYANEDSMVAHSLGEINRVRTEQLIALGLNPKRATLISTPGKTQLVKYMLLDSGA